MNRYKPYPAYKDSGVEWLGQVPEHWDISSVKWEFRSRLGKMLQTKPNELDDRTVPYHKALSVQWESVAEEAPETMWASLKEIEAYQLKQGDLLICEGGEAGRAAIFKFEASGPMIIQNSIHRVRPEKENMNEFLLRILQTASSIGWLEVLCNKATIVHFTGEKLGSLAFPAVPVEEQLIIVQYLEKETAQIDGLVEAKTRFIELLQEKRQSLITRAVTKGLDPKVKMKDSGVEWLGQVPEHWEVRRIATLYREMARVGKEELPVLSISIHSGISDKEMSNEERDRKVSLSEDREKYKRVKPNDLAYNMMRAWQGAFGAVQIDGLVSPAYVVAEPRNDIISSYVELLLRTPMAIEEMRRFSRGIADFRMRLYWEYFRDISIVVPPIDEQRRIVDNIHHKSSRIEALVTQTQRSIELLKERRSALITAAVTGKIDLREAGL